MWGIVCPVRIAAGGGVVAAEEIVALGKVLKRDVVADLTTGAVGVVQQAAAGLGAPSSYDEDEAGGLVAEAVAEAGANAGGGLSNCHAAHVDGIPSSAPLCQSTESKSASSSA